MEYSFIDNLIIEYGTLDYKINVNNLTYDISINSISTIPSGDHNRANIYGDPVHGRLKQIYLTYDNNKLIIDHNKEIHIDYTNKKFNIKKPINDNEQIILSNNFNILYAFNHNIDYNIDITSKVFNKFKYNELIYLSNNIDLDFYFGNMNCPYDKVIVINDIGSNNKYIIKGAFAIDLNKNYLYYKFIPQNIINIFKSNKKDTNFITITYTDLPNYNLKNLSCDIFKFENIINYQYQYCYPKLKLEVDNKKNESIQQNHNYYIIFDNPGKDAFGHWIFESFIFVDILKELNNEYKNIKIMTSNKKLYVKSFFNFFRINNEIVYDFEDTNNIVFIPPIISYGIINETNPKYFELFKTFMNKYVSYIYNNIINLNFENNILYLPRNKKNNFCPEEFIPKQLIGDRINIDEITHMTDAVLKYGGIVLNTLELNNISIQFSLIYNSKNIIIDYGSAFDVNTLICKNKNIIVLNKEKYDLHTKPLINKIIYDNVSSNNNVTLLTDYNNFDDIYEYINDDMAIKYKLCIMAIFKNETMNLKVWIEHYLWQGVEHFYLIDNGSKDNPLEILNEYIDKGIVSYYYRDQKFQQPQHYRYVFDKEKIKLKTKWLCICDLDEFFFGVDYKLIDALDNYDNYDVIYTNSFFYGSDNLIEHPLDIRKSILHRNNDTVNGIKYIFKPKCIKSSDEIWIHWLVNEGSIQKKYKNEIHINDKIRLNHYPIQSYEYFTKIKMTRGDVSNKESENIRDIKYFEYNRDIATIFDDSLKKIIENGYN